MKNTYQKGYTLVELLAVAVILLILTGLIAGILYSVLRGSNKSKITTTVSENGNYALTTISNLLLNSSGFVGLISFADVANNTFIKDPQRLIRSCYPAAPGAAGIVVKGFEQNAISRIIVCGSDGVISSTSAIMTSTSETDFNTANLIDVSKVAVDNNKTCAIECTQADPFTPPQIKITFNLKQLGNVKVQEQESSSEFKTTVTLRNYNP